jgi:hypothetical protein
MRYKLIKKSHFVYLSGNPMIPYLLRYLPARALQWQAGKGLAVDDYGVTLDALNLGHPRISLI